MNNKLNVAFNEQLNREFYCAYFYFGASTYFLEENFFGFSKYMKNMAIEKLKHAQKLYDFMFIRNTSINFNRIDAPNNNFINPVDVFEQTFEFEKLITSKINNLSFLSSELKDLPCVIFLQERTMEQIETENKIFRILNKIKDKTDKPISIIEEIDHHLNV